MPEKYAQIMGVQDILKRYTVFTRAQNLGIVFGPKDISVTDVIYFEAIRGKLDDVIGSSGGK